MRIIRYSTLIRVLVYGDFVVLFASIWAWALGLAVWHEAVAGAVLGLGAGIFLVRILVDL